jgi:3-oxoacyl-[acyl-carrier protein] reductase
VIGGSSGIGAAAAGVLAEEGCDVAVTYRSSPDRAQHVAADVRGHGWRAWVVPLELGRHESVTEAADALSAQVGSLDAVVLCAGHNVVTPFGRITAEEWNAVLEVNLSGAFFTLQAVAPMIRRRGGAIVTVASVAAHTGAPHHMHHAADKAGLVNLTNSMARELAPYVRANGVVPGITLTPWGRKPSTTSPTTMRRQRCCCSVSPPAGRMAQMIALVVSPITEYMTGATIDVNSGRFLR